LVGGPLQVKTPVIDYDPRTGRLKQLSGIERCVVPIPKQMTSAFLGGLCKNVSGKWAIIFVIGDSAVIPIPLTRSFFSVLLAPMAVTVAVLSRRTSLGVN
jgi:hypothetical protein